MSVLLDRNSKVMNLRACIGAGTFVPLPLCEDRKTGGERAGRDRKGE